LAKKSEEIGILKAKITLDMIQLNMRLVPEYPDLVDESHELLALVEEKQKLIEKG